jgi:hypothetical protein
MITYHNFITYKVKKKNLQNFQNSKHVFLFSLQLIIKKEGNWSEEPKDFAKLIGNQVSKLIELLTEKDAIFSKKSNSFHSNIAYVLYSIFS